ncbi:MAG: ABC transporter permease [Lachnospiraceae bacterium]|nr:ABC transporter permease [Lachnospiraceae bacterium]
MISLIKTNIKLLLRNKVFLFFLLITPILSAFVLSLKGDHTVYEGKEDIPTIIELEKCENKAVYNCNTSAFIVKVYDGAGTVLSEYVLEQLVGTGMFSVCRCDVSDMTDTEVLERASKDAFDDRAGVLLYLKSDFDRAVMDENWADAMQIYDVSDDERQELFEAELTTQLEQIAQVYSMIGADSDKITETLNAIRNEMPKKSIVRLSGVNDLGLTKEQINQKTQIGYGFAFLTLGFLFCGVCVAHTVIEEQNNKVFTRVMLSKVSSREYFISKFVVAMIVSLMQTFVLAVCLIVMQIDFGMSVWSFLLVIFLLGLIFSTLSLLLGSLMGDVMSSNYVMFAIWSISALLAGLYFPLDDTTAALKTLSNLMPQRWFLNASEMLLVGDKGAYSMLLYVTVAYLIVIISVGSVGLKMKRSEA